MKSIVEINEMTIEIYEKNNYKVWCFIRWFFLLDKSQPGSVFLLPGKMGGSGWKKNPTIQFYGWNMTIKKSMKNILNTFKYNIIIIVEYYGQMKYEDY
jgi:hypothetical protein